MTSIQEEERRRRERLEAVRLARGNGLTARQIAEQLDVSTTRVAGMLRQAEQLDEHRHVWGKLSVGTANALRRNGYSDLKEVRKSILSAGRLPTLEGISVARRLEIHEAVEIPTDIPVATRVVVWTEAEFWRCDAGHRHRTEKAAISCITRRFKGPG